MHPIRSFKNDHLMANLILFILTNLPYVLRSKSQIAQRILLVYISVFICKKELFFTNITIIITPKKSTVISHYHCLICFLQFVGIWIQLRFIHCSWLISILGLFKPVIPHFPHFFFLLNNLGGCSRRVSCSLNFADYIPMLSFNIFLFPLYFLSIGNKIERLDLSFLSVHV